MHKPAFIFTDRFRGNAKFIADAASHESGHTFSLGHDGASGTRGPYPGHGRGETSWVPIMGTGQLG